MIIASATLWDIAQGIGPFMWGFGCGGALGITIGVVVVASCTMGRG